MEYKIGQVFEINGIWYQFVEDNNKGCENCVFYQGKSECANPDDNVKCVKWIREDGRDGHFVRLLPIGDMYEQGGETWQQYKCVDKPNTEDKRVYISYTDSDIGLIISVRLTENDDLNLIERKIGEIFEHNGEWYQCIESISCENCAFNAISCDEVDDIVGPCSANLRRDGKSVVFKKLEKDGVPITVKGTYVEIKTKEDMEETNANLSNLENIGKNLKPFDLEAAKSGKPVCTRDGKKARIICFDVKGSTYPIIALIKEGEDERLCSYMPDGRRYEDEEEWTDDLMMLPEKKEGWAVIRRSDIYENEEQAKEALLNSHTAMMIRKITWEE